MVKSKYVQTANLYEASFLIARGFKVNQIDKDSGRKVLVTIEGDEVKQASLDYYNGGMVSGKAMTDAYRMLKDWVLG